jgi:hypothetical protein
MFAKATPYAQNSNLATELTCVNIHNIHRQCVSGCCFMYQKCAQTYQRAAGLQMNLTFLLNSKRVKRFETRAKV